MRSRLAIPTEAGENRATAVVPEHAVPTEHGDRVKHVLRAPLDAFPIREINLHEAHAAGFGIGRRFRRGKGRAVHLRQAVALAHHPFRVAPRPLQPHRAVGEGVVVEGAVHPGRLALLHAVNDALLRLRPAHLAGVPGVGGRDVAGIVGRRPGEPVVQIGVAEEGPLVPLDIRVFVGDDDQVQPVAVHTEELSSGIHHLSADQRFHAQLVPVPSRRRWPCHFAGRGAVRRHRHLHRRQRARGVHIPQ
ncbi:MAG: hypothetical protein BWY76_02836 [bacterium ADurb.Bin429]|nr:MAG: hypothetical protein BWY76_02836 [bacterium ADurb.Bin429]